MKYLSIFFFFTLLLTACNNQTSETVTVHTSDTTAISDSPMVGSDRDEHGCIGSAGYQWSQIKNECIRIFEAGIRLDAAGEGVDKTTSAFVIFSDDQKMAELFLPAEKAARILDRKGTEGAYVWESGSLQLSSSNGYLLKDGEKVLYQSK